MQPFAGACVISGFSHRLKNCILAFNTHAAARDAKSNVAKYAAHAAGQAVGTWHVPTHALGAFGYAGKAIIASKK